MMVCGIETVAFFKETKKLRQTFDRCRNAGTMNIHHA